jgi:cytochrome b561
VALHWVIAALVIGQFALGWWMQGIAKQPPGPRADAFNLHKSIGLTILALMSVR